MIVIDQLFKIVMMKQSDIEYQKFRKTSKRREEGMKKYVCTVCGYIYDEEKEGTKWEDLPSSWVCPMCGVGKEFFELVEE